MEETLEGVDAATEAVEVGTEAEEEWSDFCSCNPRSVEVEEARSNF